MGRDVSDRRRLICVTGGNLRNDHLYIGNHRDFFPQECYGESKARKGMGKKVKLIVEGLAEPIETDIAKAKNGGQPRNFFRKRGWVGEFFQRHGVQEDDLIAIEKVGCLTYRIYPLKGTVDPHTRFGRRERQPSEDCTLDHQSLFDTRSRASAPTQLVRDQPEMTREEVRRNGTVYTPTDLARFVAKKVVGYLLSDHSAARESLLSSGRKLRVLDPACGDGQLLEAVWHQLIRAAHRLTALPDPRAVLCGIDMEQHATLNTCDRLQRLAAESGFTPSAQAKVLTTNALFPYDLPSSAQGWKGVMEEFDANDGFDIIIANPPWGAHVDSYRERLSKGEFCLFQGQFDTSDLFVEKALAAARHGGYLAFIVPDSLFAQERYRLRELLLHQSHIKFVGRFGEKIFDKINRACAVFVCRKGPARHNAMVDCVRLTPESRKRIQAGDSTFFQEDKVLAHRVPQARFATNAGYTFDIDLNVTEEEILACLQKAGYTFGDYLEGSRGVELSKHGYVCRCPECANWLPLPSKEQVACAHCGKSISVSSLRTECIIGTDRHEGSQQIVVGESISRYAIDYSLWISTGYNGINCKDPSIYRAPKLLVRKTGVGISAAVDYTEAYTNQVVYIFHRKPDLNARALPLEFFLGVLNSRAMYYFLAKKAGEIEWRSHPYITQKQVISLPMLSPQALEEKSDLVEEISRLLGPYARNDMEPPVSVDACVERAVARLFGLSRKQYCTIYETIDTVEPLLPIRVLKRVSISDLFS